MRLADYFIPFFAALRQFQRAPADDAATLATRLEQLVSTARSQAHSAEFATEDFDNALFAAAAWADESLFALDWPGRTEWQRHLLQKRYFDTTSAGVAFFSRLESLTPQQTSVREVYYLCLAMGYAGRYGYDQNHKALKDIRQQNLQLLLQGADGLPGEAGRLLFPDGYAIKSSLTDSKNRNSQRRRPSFMTLLLIFGPLLALGLLYGIYHMTLWQMVNTILPQIQ